MLPRALRCGGALAAPALRTRALSSAPAADTRKRVALLFPGQGSQSVGMSADFIASFACARRTVEEAEALLQRPLGELMLKGPIEALTETANSQLAIYVASMAVLRALREAAPDLRVVACAGLSLGEYTALTAAGRVRFEECLAVVRARGELMERACRAEAGAMAAVHGLPRRRPAPPRPAPRRALPPRLTPCAAQVVVSGAAEGVAALAAAARAAGAKRVIPLKVAGAFHSGLMRPAADALAPLLAALPIAPGAAPVAMNVPGGFVEGEEAVRGHLVRQVTEPVRWEACVRAIAAAGADLFLEVGSGGVLAALNPRILPGPGAPPTLPLDRLSRLDELAALL
eukprot:tig00021127_g18828.t1